MTAVDNSAEMLAHVRGAETVLADIEELDLGRGFDAATLQAADDDLVEAERGRGLGVMRAVVDRVDLTSRPEAGTIVTLEKVLTYSDGALLVGRRKQV